MNILLKLYLSFFKIGIFGYGGGYAMLPLIEKEVAINNQWLSGSEFLDIIGVSQMTPGPISINTATFVGYRVAGVWGSFFATLGVVSFSFILVSIATHYILKFKDSKVLKLALKGMRPALVGLIFSAFLSLAGKSYLDIKSVIIGGSILLVSMKTKIHPILTIVIAGAMGTLFYGVL